MTGTWTIAPVDSRAASVLAEELGVSEVTASVLVRRGYGSPDAARAFLAADVPAHDPLLLGDMAIAVERINAGDNPNFLSPEGETFRWATDAETIVATTPEGSNVGVPIGDELQTQLDTYAEVGYFGDADTPQAQGRYHPDLVADLYDDEGVVIWPS